MKAAREASRELVGDDAEVPITGETNLVASGLLDSMGFMNFLVKVESHFDVEVDLEDTDPSEFATIAGLSRAILRSAKYAD
jgi:acyl carrier protein